MEGAGDFWNKYTAIIIKILKGFKMFPKVPGWWLLKKMYCLYHQNIKTIQDTSQSFMLVTSDTNIFLLSPEAKIFLTFKIFPKVSCYWRVMLIPNFNNICKFHLTCLSLSWQKNVFTELLSSSLPFLLAPSQLSIHGINVIKLHLLRTCAHSF